MIDPTIKNLIAARRAMKPPMSITAHAEAAGVDRATLHHYLAGTKQPTLPVMRKLCRPVGLDLVTVARKSK